MDPAPVPVGLPAHHPDAEPREVPLLTEQFTPDELAARERAAELAEAEREARAEELDRLAAKTAAEDATDPDNRAEWHGGPYDGVTSRPSPVPDKLMRRFTVCILGREHTYFRPDLASADWYCEDDYELTPAGNARPGTPGRGSDPPAIHRENHMRKIVIGLATALLAVSGASLVAAQPAAAAASDIQCQPVLLSPNGVEASCQEVVVLSVDEPHNVTVTIVCAGKATARTYRWVAPAIGTRSWLSPKNYCSTGVARTGYAVHWD